MNIKLNHDLNGIINVHIFLNEMSENYIVKKKNDRSKESHQMLQLLHITRKLNLIFNLLITQCA